MDAPILRAESLGKTFWRERVLTSASLRSESGHITALMGRNGSGKTTLLRISAGLLRADYGCVEFRDRLYERPRLAVLARRGLFFLPERGLLPSGLELQAAVVIHASRSVRDGIAALEFGPRDPERVARDALGLLGLSEQVGRRIHDLSAGERRLAEVAAAMARRPLCLLADEPFLELAPLRAKGVAEVLRRMARAGCAVVVTGHERREILEVADRVMWMTAGTTHTLGAPSDALDHHQFRREYLGPGEFTVEREGLPSRAHEKVSIAVVIPAPGDGGSHTEELGRFLAVRRPPDDEELPDVWGLPAASLRTGETPEEAVRRIGRDKLGVELEAVDELERGALDRPSGTLRMRLHEARITEGMPSVPGDAEGVTQYVDWCWSGPGRLRESARRGSLCSRLHLRHLDEAW